MTTDDRKQDLIEKAAKGIDPSAWHGGVAHDPRWAGEAESRRITARRQAGAALAVFEHAHTATDDERGAIIAALLDELGWDWEAMPEEHIPSSREILGDMADRVLAVTAGFRRTVQGEPTPVRFVAQEPTVDEQAQAELDSERLRQIAEWLSMELGHEETSQRVALIADRHDRLAAGFRRPEHPSGHTFATDACVTRECDCTEPQTEPSGNPGQFPTDAVRRNDEFTRLGNYTEEPQAESTIRDHVRALTGVTDEVLDELGGFQGEPTDAQVLAALNAYEAWSAEETLDMWGSDQVDRMRAALRAAAETTKSENGSEQ